jgi:ribosomal protein L16 Arg81 hydroxylase
MAALTVTPQALDCIRQIIEREEIRSPLVAVAWSSGQAELRRNAAGEAVWEREPSGWLATVLDLEEVEEAAGAWSGPVLEMHGYKFSFSERPSPPQFEGCTLACEGGKLVIHEAAT